MDLTIARSEESIEKPRTTEDRREFVDWVINTHSHCNNFDIGGRITCIGSGIPKGKRYNVQFCYFTKGTNLKQINSWNYKFLEEDNHFNPKTYLNEQAQGLGEELTRKGLILKLDDNLSELNAVKISIS